MSEAYYFFPDGQIVKFFDIVAVKLYSRDDSIHLAPRMDVILRDYSSVRFEFSTEEEARGAALELRAALQESAWWRLPEVQVANNQEPKQTKEDPPLQQPPASGTHNEQKEETEE